MKVTDALLVAFGYITSFLFGLLGARFNVPEYYLFIAPILIIASSPLIDSLKEWIEKRREEKIGEFIKSGWGPTRLTLSIQQFLASVSIIGMIVSLIYGIISSRRGGFSILSLYMYVGFSLLLALSLFVDTIIVNIKVSERKTSVEVEFPFLLAMIKVLSETHLTLYDLLETIKNSRALKAWSSEIRKAENMAVATGSSLITAISFLAENHPSEIVRSLFKRIIIVGDLTGSIGDVSERIFSYIYEKFKDKMEGLKSNFDIITNLVILLLVLIPIMLMILPVTSPETPSSIFTQLVFIGLTVFFLSYLLLSQVYPDGFKVNTPLSLQVIVAVSYILVMIIMIVESAPILSSWKTEPPLPILQYYMVLTVLIAIPALAGELVYVNVRVYTRLIRAITDAIEISARSGEPFLNVLKRIAGKYGSRVKTLADMLSEGYNIDVYRRTIVERAPTIFHASYLETLMIALSIGAPLSALLALSKAYESLVNAWEKGVSFSRIFEFYMVMASSIDLAFAEMFGKSMVSIFHLFRSGGLSVPLALPFLMRDLTPIYTMFLVVIPPIIALTALIMGKTRSGSLAFGGRAGLIVLLTSIVTIIAMKNISIFKFG